MRIVLAAAALLGMLVMGTPPGLGQGPTVLLSVDDGEFFYDEIPDDDICEGTTNDHTQGVAVRHRHYGVPFTDADLFGGFGCLGGPKTWAFTVAADHEATVSGTLTYTWDQDVANGGFNDVHLHVKDAAGALVTSTLILDGLNPIVPGVDVSKSHAFSFTLGPGPYTLEEDVFVGFHTAWLTQLTVVQA